MKIALRPLLPMLAVAFVGAGSVSSHVRPQIEAPPAESSTLDAHETHASMSLVGQMRTSVSSWLWVRADLYLHNGVEMRPLTEQEVHQGVSAMKSGDGSDEQLAHEASVTVIPAADRDFRGWFGDVERAVSSYKDMHGHKHNNPVQSLPLFRLMTWLDPQFVVAWTTGAHIISNQREPGAIARGLAFLDEGLAHNPNSVALYAEKGSLHMADNHDLVRAERDFSRAIELGEANWARLDDDAREAMEVAYRYLALIHRDTGRGAAQTQIALKGLRRFPDDRVLKRLAGQP